MKIVVHNGSRVWGGNEKWLTILAEGLRRRGHEVVVSCRRGGAVWRRLEELGVRTTAVRPGGDADPINGVRFARMVARERPDTVLLTTWNRVVWAAWAGRRAGARVVVRLGIVRRGRARPDHRWSVRRYVDAVIANSSEAAASWPGFVGGFPPERVHRVLNGIAPRRPLAPAEVEAVRRDLGLERDGRWMVAIGHLHPRKGIDLLLDALARLDDPAVRLAAVGSGPAEPALHAQAESLGIADRVRWLGFREDAREIVGAFDLFVLSSRNEGMANVMLEAMAAGVPVVATRISGVLEAIGERSGRPPAGWIVPAEDAAGLAEGIRAALDVLAAEPSAAAARVAEARWRVEHWFGVERMIDEAERILFPPSGST